MDRFAAGETTQSDNFRLSQPTFETFAGVVSSGELTMQIGWLPTTVEEQLPPPELPVNDLDLLSDVTALHGETLQFLVSAKDLTGALTFTLDRSSPTASLIKGQLSLTPYGRSSKVLNHRDTEHTENWTGIRSTAAHSRAARSSRMASDWRCTDHSEALLYMTMIPLLLRRLTRSKRLVSRICG